MAALTTVTIHAPIKTASLRSHGKQGQYGNPFIAVTMEAGGHDVAYFYHSYNDVATSIAALRILIRDLENSASDLIGDDEKLIAECVRTQLG